MVDYALDGHLVAGRWDHLVAEGADGIGLLVGHLVDLAAQTDSRVREVEELWLKPDTRGSDA
jgi:hypothetical protein